MSAAATAMPRGLPLGLLLSIARRSPSLVVGAAVTLVLILAALLSPFVAPFSPVQVFTADALSPPGAAPAVPAGSQDGAS